MDHNTIQMIIELTALVLSIVMHEVAHGYMANALGDPTARLAGRLTLNPVKHIDPVGSVMVPGMLLLSNANFLFGWAKPVPYNPYNLNNQRWGEALVAFAGPGTNILLAVVFAGVIRLAASATLVSPDFLTLLYYIVYINILLACFNLIPIPPLDGSKIISVFLPRQLERTYRAMVERLEQYGPFASFFLVFGITFLMWKPFSGFVQGVVRILVGA
jgi:Zn-dependent protease